MYSEYHHLEDLKNEIVRDKEDRSVGAASRNRYPIRFVLFDNFRDCYEFVEWLQGTIGAIVKSVDGWLDPEYPDQLISHVTLCEKMTDYIKGLGAMDCVIAPFSELARFYENSMTRPKFDVLLKTLKGLEASIEGSERNQRVYVPIVGLEGKMEKFGEDSQAYILRQHTEENELNYRLVLTKRTTYGVKGLEKHFTMVNDLKEWLGIWKDTKKQTTPEIICQSKSIFTEAVHAQPDNAFAYEKCGDAYEFLTKGLRLNFGGLERKAGDEDYWEKLAQEIDITDGFNFDAFVKNYFSTNAIDDYKDFIRLWFDKFDPFSRWLLSRYYQSKAGENDYMNSILAKVSDQSNLALIGEILLDMDEIDAHIEARQYCLKVAAQNNVVLTEALEATLSSRLEGIAGKYNAEAALRYFSGISQKEREIAVSWLGKEKVTPYQVRHFYPDLYLYADTAIGGLDHIAPEWVTDYMTAYKKAKIANKYTPEIEAQITKVNASEVAFTNWYQSFKTTRTILANRGDIEVFYWIDGLGIEWIPLVMDEVKKFEHEKIYLNEVIVARSILPTTTAVNKADLQKIRPDDVLQKLGDLDGMAHKQGNKYPETLISEIETVRGAIRQVLQTYGGKKIAIVSDHGMTYLSQLRQGLNLGGVTSDHYGRACEYKKGVPTADDHYVRLENNPKTMVALRHESLCEKVPVGQGAHGGATPEEVLVPIFIISSSPANTNWSAKLITLELNGSNPRVRFDIKNLPSVESPTVRYNGMDYKLKLIAGTVYESDALALDANANLITLQIGNVSQSYQVLVDTGAQEDDLFSF